MHGKLDSNLIIDFFKANNILPKNNNYNFNYRQSKDGIKMWYGKGFNVTAIIRYNPNNNGWDCMLRNRKKHRSSEKDFGWIIYDEDATNPPPF